MNGCMVLGFLLPFPISRVRFVSKLIDGQRGTPMKRALCLFMASMLLSVNCKRVNDPISLAGIHLSGGVINLTLDHIKFRIEDGGSRLRGVVIYAKNGPDTLILDIYSANDLRSNSSYSLSAFRSIGFESRFHSLPDSINVASSGWKGMVRFTFADTAACIAGEFPDDATLIERNSSDPNNIVTFPVRVWGSFQATRE